MNVIIDMIFKNQQIPDLNKKELKSLKKIITLNGYIKRGNLVLNYQNHSLNLSKIS